MSFRRTKGRIRASEVSRNLLHPAFTGMVVKPNVEDFSFAPPLSPPCSIEMTFFLDVYTQLSKSDAALKAIFIFCNELCSDISACLGGIDVVGFGEAL